MPNTDTASPAEASSPRAAPIPLPSMFSRGIDTEAAMRALASLSSRIELSRPTPELALVNLASTVAEQSRQLTEVVLQTIAATRDSATASSASADRLAALEAGLIDLTGKIAQLAAAPVKPAKPAKTTKPAPESDAETEGEPPTDEAEQDTGTGDSDSLEALQVRRVEAPRPAPQRAVKYWI